MGGSASSLVAAARRVVGCAAESGALGSWEPTGIQLATWRVQEVSLLFEGMAGLVRFSFRCIGSRDWGRDGLQLHLVPQSQGERPDA